MLRAIQRRPYSMRQRSAYLDRTPAWYDHHPRVFYIYSLGRFHNQAVYVYGDTHDLDVVEFQLRSIAPMYGRVMYVPLQNQGTRENMNTIIQQTTIRVRVDVRGLEDWDAFTCENIRKVIDKLEIRKWVDWE